MPRIKQKRLIYFCWHMEGSFIIQQVPVMLNLHSPASFWVHFITLCWIPISFNKDAHRLLQSARKKYFRDFRVIPLILDQFGGGHLKHERYFRDLMSKEGISPQKKGKEAVTVQEEYLGWEEQVNDRKGIFLQMLFWKSQNNNEEFPALILTGFFCPYSFLKCFDWFLHPLLLRHFHCLFKSVFKIQICEANLQHPKSPLNC